MIIILDPNGYDLWLVRGLLRRWVEMSTSLFPPVGLLRGLGSATDPILLPHPKSRAVG